MKAHIHNPKTLRPACQNKIARAGRSFDQNYVVMSPDEFAAMEAKNPAYCCKKCLEIAKKS